MKTVFTVLVLLCAITSFAQEKNPCDKPYTIIGSMMMGGSTRSTHGIVETFEAGLWGRYNGIGISGGIMLYDGKLITSEKVPSPYTPLEKELFIRPTWKIDHNEIIGFHHAITIFAGAKGNYGTSYRAYYQPGRNIMIGLEPYISKMNGRGLNLIVTCAF